MDDKTNCMVFFSFFLSFKLFAVAHLDLIDPPAEVKITTTTGLGIINLKKGFSSHMFEASAESYPAIACNNVMITWVSSTRGNVQSCQVKGYTNVSMFLFHSTPKAYPRQL